MHDYIPLRQPRLKFLFLFIVNLLLIMSNTSNVIGYIVHLIVSFFVAWLVLSAIIAWLRPNFYTAAGTVNWGTTAWVALILLIFFVIVTWIIYWIFSAIGSSHPKSDMMCVEPVDPCAAPAPVKKDLMCFKPAACPKPAPCPEPQYNYVTPMYKSCTPAAAPAASGAPAPWRKSVKMDGAFEEVDKRKIYGIGTAQFDASA